MIVSQDHVVTASQTRPATLCCAHSPSEDGVAALDGQVGEARWPACSQKPASVSFRKAKATPFNLILEAKV
jgi:hypothetical protein